MKRILIISELFYPTNCIGALRPTKICKFLIDKGYNIDVITEYPSAGIYNSKNCKVYSLKPASPNIQTDNQAVRHVNLSGEFWDQLRYFERSIKSYCAEKKYSKKAIALFEKGILNADDYDACFTTFGPISSVLIGLRLKRKYHIKNWICDFRDPIVVKRSSIFIRPFHRYLQNTACRYADKIVAVSNGYVHRICGNKYLDKSYMIPNGYDISDADTNYQKRKNSKLTLTYVGALYEGKRDITPVFKVISDLCLSGEFDKSNIEFVYAGSDYAALVTQAKKYDMEQILKNCGKLSRNNCLQLQYDSDILILSTWNERGEEGVFPGKFLEYMLIGRPIISLTCGKIPNGEVTAVMREGNFGAAYESANDKEDFEALKRYIKRSYDEWLNTGNITFKPIQAVLDRYNYDNIMERLEEIICGSGTR